MLCRVDPRINSHPYISYYDFMTYLTRKKTLLKAVDYFQKIK
eukprot:XP_001709130.1 Hypothetical protein GL50803_2797 [Giardia lamblia ATCC 50803]